MSRVCEKPTAVYTITCCDGVYGGITTNVKNRLSQHKKRWPDATIEVVRWLDVGDDWVVAEREHIASLHAVGLIVLNKSTGGNGPGVHTDETKQALSVNGKRRYEDEPWRRDEISENLRIRFGDDAARAAVSARMKGVPKSDEHRVRISAALKGREGKMGVDNAFYGQTHTEATRAKMRAAWVKRRGRNA